MSAEARKAAGKKGYENVIGAMSAEARTAVWEEKYAEFDNYDGMLESTSTSYLWQRDQLTGFDGQIKKENAANKGSPVWKDIRARLVAEKEKRHVGRQVGGEGCRVR